MNTTHAADTVCDCCRKPTPKTPETWRPCSYRADVFGDTKLVLTCEECRAERASDV